MKVQDGMESSVRTPLTIQRFVRLPLVAALVALGALVLFFLRYATGYSTHPIVYALDDTYIQMAIAKNLSLDMTWGINAGEFASASSSILWPLLLGTVYAGFGINEFAPFLLNLLFAAAAIVFVEVILCRTGVPALPRFVILASLVLLVPLPAMIIVGMEHILHLLAVIAFTYYLSYLKPGSVRSLYPVALLAAVMTGARYEGLFVLGAGCLVLLLQRRFLHSLVIFAAGLLPVCVFAVVSLGHGWEMLPNPILIKGSVPGWHSLSPVGLVFDLPSSVLRNPYLSLVSGTALVLLIRLTRNPRPADSTWVMLPILLLTAMMHALFADTGSFYRYEAYLVGLAVFAIGVNVAQLDIRFDWRARSIRPLAVNLVGMGVAGLLVFPVVERAARALKETPEAILNRFEEHLHVATFVSSYGDSPTVAVDQIGAVSFYGNVRVLDVYGLGSHEPLEFRRQAQGLTADAVFEWTRRENVTFAVITEDWVAVSPLVPDRWIKVAEWRIRRRGRTKPIGFYAVDPSQAGTLAVKLDEYTNKLPGSVDVIVGMSQ